MGWASTFFMLPFHKEKVVAEVVQIGQAEQIKYVFKNFLKGGGEIMSPIPYNKTWQLRQKCVFLCVKFLDQLRAWTDYMTVNLQPFPCSVYTVITQFLGILS